MRKLILLAGAVVLLVAAPVSVTAKTVTVDISKAGFVPAAVTIQTGDTVTFTNKDTANHQVVCATCPFTSPVLTPNQSFPFTFTKVGKFNLVDPLNKNKKATVTVAAAPATLTVSAAPRTLNYGAPTTVSGTLSTALANQKVDILAQPCGENAAKAVGTVTTGTGGAFTYHAQPTLNTIYQARVGAGAQRRHEPCGQRVDPPDREVAAERGAQVHHTGGRGSVVRRQGRRLPALGCKTAPLDPCEDRVPRLPVCGHDSAGSDDRQQRDVRSGPSERSQRARRPGVRSGRPVLPRREVPDDSQLVHGPGPGTMSRDLVPSYFAWSKRCCTAFQLTTSHHAFR